MALYPEFGAAWYALGMARRNAGPREEASAALAKAQEFGARWPAVDDPLLAQVKALRDDASANAERGLQRERQGDLAGAIQAYEAAVAVDPATIAPRVNLIALYGRQQDWTKAAAHYDALASSGVAIPAEAHFNHGVCLAAQGRMDAAADLFRLAVVVESAVCQRVVEPWPDRGRCVDASKRQRRNTGTPSNRRPEMPARDSTSPAC